MRYSRSCTKCFEIFQKLKEILLVKVNLSLMSLSPLCNGNDPTEECCKESLWFCHFWNDHIFRPNFLGAGYCVIHSVYVVSCGLKWVHERASVFVSAAKWNINAKLTTRRWALATDWLPIARPLSGLETLDVLAEWVNHCNCNNLGWASPEGNSFGYSTVKGDSFFSMCPFGVDSCLRTSN